VIDGALVTEAEDRAELVARLRDAARSCVTEAEVRTLTGRIADLTRQYRLANGVGFPVGPAEQAADIDTRWRMRPHTVLLSDRIAEALAAVERGESRRLIVTMPPRAGKSMLTSLYTPLWLLRRHPDWSIVSLSHGAGLATLWGKQVRRLVETGKHGIQLAPDSKASSEWETTAGGGMLARGMQGSLTGRGAKVMIIDDPVKDYADAHSKTKRDSLWDWWLSVAQTRLEPPFLLLVVMTRWHEDDFVGRLLSTEHEGDPDDWELINVPAIAEDEDDALGRAPGEPLLSPLLDETPTQALRRWESTKRDVGAYTWASLFQQRPAPDGGAVFDTSWWRYWTRDPKLAAGNDDIVLLPPEVKLSRLPQLQVWDAAFKDDETSSFVVGQAWATWQRAPGTEPMYMLLDQRRERLAFTATVRAVKAMLTKWPHASRVLIEDKANGTAVIDVLSRLVPKVKPWPATGSKVERARAVTPLVEAGRVLLPHPSEAPWITTFIDECRDFPHSEHDDQVDALGHALTAMSQETFTVPMVAPLEGTKSSDWAW
jgi:predicted phage terminase large subunit-like protein